MITLCNFTTSFLSRGGDPVTFHVLEISLSFSAKLNVFTSQPRYC